MEIWFFPVVEILRKCSSLYKICIYQPILCLSHNKEVKTKDGLKTNLWSVELCNSNRYQTNLGVDNLHYMQYLPNLCLTWICKPQCKQTTEFSSVYKEWNLTYSCPGKWVANAYGEFQPNLESFKLKKLSRNAPTALS